MGLHVADGLGVHAGHALREHHRLHLPVGAGRGEADLEGAVVAEGEAFDHGVDPVAVRLRVGEALQRHDGDAVARHRAARLGVEGPAMAVGGEDPAGLVHVALRLREEQRRAAGQREVALVREQALAGDADRGERGGAGGLHVHARAAQVEFVGNPGGEVVLLVGQPELVRAGGGAVFGMRIQMVDRVGVQARAAEDADQALVATRIAARALQRLGGAFEENPVLRVDQLGLARGVAEERGVEPVGLLDDAARRHVVRVAGDGRAARREFLGRESPDALGARAEVFPELLDRVRAGETAGERHQGDAFAGR